MDVIIKLSNDQIPSLCKLLGVTRYVTDLKTGQVLIDWHPEDKLEENVHPQPQKTDLSPKRYKVCPLCGEKFVPKKSMKQKYCDVCIEKYNGRPSRASKESRSLAGEQPSA